MAVLGGGTAATIEIAIADGGIEALRDRIAPAARRSPFSADGQPAALAAFGCERALTRKPVDDDPEPHSATLVAVAHVSSAPDSGPAKAANPSFGL